MIGKNVSFKEIDRIAQLGYFLNGVDPRTGETSSAQSSDDLQSYTQLVISADLRAGIVVLRISVAKSCCT